MTDSLPSLLDARRECAHADCEQIPYRRGYCTKHYFRLKATGNSEGIRTSTCKICGDQFTEASRRGWVWPSCPTCRALHYECERCPALIPIASGRRTRRCARCERDRQLVSLYGITLDQLELIIEFQGGVCAICERPIDLSSARVDHDHSCCSAGRRSCGGCVRGILCDGCNVGIGSFRDDPEALLNAADYLRGHRIRRS